MSAASKIVCICGSTRFRAEIAEANRLETLDGRFVLAPGAFGHDGDPMTNENKVRLDALRHRKIYLADEVLVVNPGGYIRESTTREIAYVHATGTRCTAEQGPLQSRPVINPRSSTRPSRQSCKRDE